VLVLTEALGSQSGSFVVDLPSAATPVMDFTATFQARVGGGTEPPADGFSFVLGPELPTGPFGEDGAGAGLILSFDTYVNEGEESPHLEVVYNAARIAKHNVTIDVLRTGNAFAQVAVRLNRNGTLDLIYGEHAIFAGLAVPVPQDFVANRFGFGSRTGGANDNHWIDDIKLSLNLQPPLVRLDFGRQGDNLVLAWEGTAVLQSAPALAGPWDSIAGATSPYVVTPVSAAEFYRLRQ
jgi:hypothetical protein